MEKFERLFAVSEEEKEKMERAVSLIRDSFQIEDIEKWKRIQDEMRKQIQSSPHSGKIQEVFASLKLKISKVTEPAEVSKSRQKIKGISGVDLVTLTIMVLQKNRIKITDIENISSFTKKILTSFRIDKNYEAESFRVKLYDFTAEGRDYPNELKTVRPKKHSRLVRYLQRDSGKELERIVIESL